MDHTKFKLKNTGELTQLLTDKDDLYIISCNKCFKEFAAETEPECGEFAMLAAEQGKKVAGSAVVDFLCNQSRAEQCLSGLPADIGCIFVIACGLGTQTIAALTDIPVITACESVGFGGRHGMTLSGRLCGACGQCFLNTTGGICPVVDCSKELINGQCGGSSGGKCENDNTKDCAWSKIQERLGLQDRADVHREHPVQLRDYSKINNKFINKYVKALRDKRFEGFYGGVYPKESKENTESIHSQIFPIPRIVTIPLSQHAGAPAEPVVKVGDEVMKGQKIGEAAGFISSTIHASTSGVVKAIEPRPHPLTGNDVMYVVIESDFRDELHKSVKPCEYWAELDIDDIDAIIAEKGIVGMGGAGFPTTVKLKSQKPVDTILLNGSECEPYLTADHRVMLEYADDILFGLRVLLKATGAKRGLIVIEDNKPDAITRFMTKTADIDNIEVFAAKTKYPQGAEKMLIKRALKRRVPPGCLPSDVGVVVLNISTAKAVSDAFQTGMPLVERVVTVSGEKIRNPGNYIVKIGTSVNEIIEYCGGLTEDDAAVILGGPMMGTVINTLDVPVIKGTGGIIAVAPDISEPSACIRCGRCVDACPMELLPLYYPVLAEKEDWEGMNEKSVRDCVECGCCDHICTSGIKIKSAIKLGKEMLRTSSNEPKYLAGGEK